MTSPYVEFAVSLLKGVAREQPSDFAGLGVVFYDHLEALPFIALDVAPRHRIQTPVEGLWVVAKTLSRVSSRSSGCHDGFHLVESQHQRLTHVAQFLSPPLPRSEQPPRESGARHMTALLTSSLEGIDGVGVLSQRGELTLYVAGSLSLRETMQ